MKNEKLMQRNLIAALAALPVAAVVAAGPARADLSQRRSENRRRRTGL